MTRHYGYKQYNMQLRERVDSLRKKYGTTNKFIADYLKTSTVTISNFLKEDRDLCLENCKKLDKFLKERGF